MIRRAYNLFFQSEPGYTGWARVCSCYAPDRAALMVTPYLCKPTGQPLPESVMNLRSLHPLMAADIITPAMTLMPSKSLPLIPLPLFIRPR